MLCYIGIVVSAWAKFEFVVFYSEELCGWRDDHCKNDGELYRDQNNQWKCE